MARKVIGGIPVSSGIAIGKAFFLNRRRGLVRPRLVLSSSELKDELKRLELAISSVAQEMEEVRKKIPADLKEHEAILNSHLMILKDEKLFGQAKRFIQEQQINAEWAIEKAVFELEKIFNALDNEYIRQRLQDINLVADKVVSVLLGTQKTLPKISQRVILLAHDLAPTDTVLLEVDKIMAFATTMGGKTSHAALWPGPYRFQP